VILPSAARPDHQTADFASTSDRAEVRNCVFDVKYQETIHVEEHQDFPCRRGGASYAGKERQQAAQLMGYKGCRR
jgi:hypothetical protein